jgi:hypothetical protein
VRLSFLPPRLQRANILIWLKRVHAWTGFWGAALFLFLGASGFLLNHRTVLKIDTGAPVELSEAALAVAPGAIVNQDALGAWAKRELAFSAEPKPVNTPVGQDSGKGRFLGKERPTTPVWRVAFPHPDGAVTATYSPGSTAVLVKREANGLLGIVKNLHKGTGLGVAWILFLDTIAGALIAMALTGFLLWSRLHGPRLLAGGLIAGSMTAASVAAWPHFLAAQYSRLGRAPRRATDLPSATSLTHQPPNRGAGVARARVFVTRGRQ